MKFKNSIDYENSIAPHIGITSKIIEYHLQEIFIEKEIDLTKEQMIVLKKLISHKNIAQNKLARIIFRDKSSTTRLLKKMEKKGYIQRTCCENDKRIKRVNITSTGIKIFAETESIRKEIIAKTEQNITKEEKAILIATLTKIKANFNPNTQETSL
jgi:DNA-binding MarR family transcriptional regulator